MSAIAEKGAYQGAGVATPARRAGRWVALDGLRGVAALALLTTHVAMVQGLIGTEQTGSKLAPTNFIGGFFTSGFQIFAGVFFVMTGLLIYRPLAASVITGAPKADYGNFWRRAARILPGYWLMVATTLVALNLGNITSVWYVIRPFLCLQVYNWGGWINGQEITWTVPDMVQFYLFLPIVAWVTHKYAARGVDARQRAYRLMAPVPFMMVAGFVWLFIVKARNMGTRALFWWPMGLLPEVAIGMTLAILLVLSKVSPKDTPKIFKFTARHPNVVLLVAVAALITNCARPFSQIGMDDIYTVDGLVLFYVLLALFGACLVLPVVAPGTDSKIVRGVFTNKPILFLSKISYGVYIWQFAVMHFYLQPGNLFTKHVKGVLFLRQTSGFLVLWSVTLVLTMVIATISYYALERPLLQWAERHSDKRTENKTGIPVTAGAPESSPA
jgi:peptidoglycan/LPS O-acetylase OafA/YrhL